MDTQTFEEMAAQWCAFRNSQFYQFWNLTGSWEKWVQTDLAAFINTHRPGLNIEREKPVFNDPEKKADLFIQSGHFPGLSIKVRCQSRTVQPNFIRYLQSDARDFGSGQFRPYYGNATPLLMCLYFEKRPQIWMQHMGFKEIFANANIGCAVLTLNKP